MEQSQSARTEEDAQETRARQTASRNAASQANIETVNAPSAPNGKVTKVRNTLRSQITTGRPRNAIIIPHGHRSGGILWQGSACMGILPAGLPA